MVFQILLVEEVLWTEFTFDIPHCRCGSVLTGLLMGCQVLLLFENLVTELTLHMMLTVMSFSMTVQPAFGRKTLTTPILCTLKLVSISMDLQMCLKELIVSTILLTQLTLVRFDLLVFGPKMGSNCCPIL